MVARRPVEVSVVMPCLNEGNTIGACIQKALEAFQQEGLAGEVIVCDNGSTDDSAIIARSLGARVVHEPARGYGSAYLKGIAEAKGRYIVIGDSDNTYDFSELGGFVDLLRDGYDLVMGSRFKGRILPGAMPWAHQYIGNPALTGILNVFFRTGVSDAHCGIRAFTREAYERMQLRATGMEFASEMVIKAARTGLAIGEVPVTYYPREGESKLRSLRDGWRHLRFMLLLTPTYLFVIPGLTLSLVGFILLLALVRGPIQIGDFPLDVHPMVLGSLLAILGFQTASLGLYAKTFARIEHYDESDPLTSLVKKHFTLERGIVIGLLLVGCGLGIFLYILALWLKNPEFGGLIHLREAILAMTLMVTGVQTIFSSFFLSIMEMASHE